MPEPQSHDVTLDPLASWHDSEARAAIVAFVERVTTEGGNDFVPPSDRVAVFDNDGTLWCEKPMPIEVGFILLQLAAAAEADESLRDREPWRAARERDYAWLDDAVTRHYHGDDGGVQVLIAGLLQSIAGMTVEDYGAAADAFLREGSHPTLGRKFDACGYRPMLELLRYLEAYGFTCYIASGGDRDFMRPVTEAMYGIPSERVIGTSAALRYLDDEHGGSVTYAAEMEVFDDGPVKPVRIWSRIGRRPIFAAGNSNGDIPMLRYAGGPGRPAFRLLLRHDDADREFEYTKGAESALELAAEHGWTVVSMKDDWSAIFADAAGP
jgi:phosphoserine phosphatase